MPSYKYSIEPIRVDQNMKNLSRMKKGKMKYGDGSLSDAFYTKISTNIFDISVVMNV